MDVQATSNAFGGTAPNDGESEHQQVGVTRVRAPQQVGVTRVRAPEQVGVTRARASQQVGVTRARAPQHVGVTRARALIRVSTASVTGSPVTSALPTTSSRIVLVLSGKKLVDKMHESKKQSRSNFNID